MTYLLDEIDTTMDVIISDDPFDKIVGQEHAVRLVKTAVRQKRHVLLCGAPGTGKSMLAKASASLLPPPRQKILLEHDPANPDRPRVVVADVSENGLVVGLDRETRDCQYVRPENLPRDVAVNMGYRCPRCDAFSVPDLVCCQDCGTPKRHDWDTGLEYYRLFRTLNIVGERALREVTTRETDEDGNMQEVTYIRENGMGDYVKRLVLVRPARRHETEGRARILVNATAPRFVRVSGSSPVELLGDVKHDPYGGSEAHGTPAYLRVIPGAIHEAHEGILYVDEIATLGSYQKHLLTAMQDKRYPISGHNPESAGAAVRVDDVPCDFILFASCNPEDLPMILPP
ncbi:MAG: ATP-binding protein, partial [Candidatus Thorarchaeota archaeon]